MSGHVRMWTHPPHWSQASVVHVSPSSHSASLRQVGQGQSSHVTPGRNDLGSGRVRQTPAVTSSQTTSGPMSEQHLPGSLLSRIVMHAEVNSKPGMGNPSPLIMKESKGSGSKAITYVAAASGGTFRIQPPTVLISPSSTLQSFWAADAHT